MSFSVPEVQALKSREFQDWLATVGLIKRLEAPSDDTYKGRQKTTPWAYQKLMTQILGGKNWGYLIPRIEVAKEMYGARAGYEEYNLVNQIVHYYRSNNLTPDDFFMARNAGFARGVISYMRMGPVATDTLYYLWKSPGHVISYKQLCVKLYGSTGVSVSASYNLYNLRRALSGTTVKIISGDRGEGAAHLVW